MKTRSIFIFAGLIVLVFLGSNRPVVEPVVSAPLKEPAALIAASSSVVVVPKTTSLIHATTSDVYIVEKVVDGDTLTVSQNGKKETVRLIGINTPETVDPRKTVECFGTEASKKTKELLVGRSVVIESDPTQDVRDKYGRLLGYVFRDDGLFVNDVLIREGYAYEYTYKVPYKYQTQFKKAEQEARVGERGLWAKSACASATKLPVKSEPVVVAPSTGGYVCSINTYNCTDFKTQAEAQTVFTACGGPTTDIHKLDSDGDGFVCESLK